MTEINDEAMTPTELAERLRGRSDKEVNKAIEARGVESVLNRIFTEMQARFRPDVAGDASAVVQWNIVARKQTHRYTVMVEDGVCRVEDGPAPAPRITFGLSLPDFLRFVTGGLDPVQGYMNGRFEIAGDVLFTETFGSWFAPAR